MDKKDLKREYRETKIPMGVYQIRNLTNGKVFVGSSLNLSGIFNRYKFALIAGSHPNKALQADWSKLGTDKFALRGAKFKSRYARDECAAAHGGRLGPSQPCGQGNRR